MRDAIRSRKKDQLINFSVEKRDATQRVIELSYSSKMLQKFFVQNVGRGRLNHDFSFSPNSILRQ